MLSLNLLPPQRKQAADLRHDLQRWYRAIFLLGLGMVLMIGGLQYGVMFLQNHQQTVQSQLDALTAREQQIQRTSLTQTTTTLNSTVKIFGTLVTPTRDWPADLLRAVSELPPGITLSSMSISPTSDVSLDGTAATRAAFLKLQEVMTASNILLHATTTASANKRDTIPFTYKAKLAPAKSP